MDYLHQKANVLKSYINSYNSEELLISKIQEEVISFCRDYYNLQKKKSFYNIDFKEQLVFNNCVEICIDNIKKEYAIIDEFYQSCKEINLEENTNNLCYDKKNNLKIYYDDYLTNKYGVYIDYIDYKFEL